MNNALEFRKFNRPDESDLIGSLQNLLDRKHEQFVSSARRHWERNFAGNDPSDACVSVRISASALSSAPLTIIRSRLRIV